VAAGGIRPQKRISVTLADLGKRSGSIKGDAIIQERTAERTNTAKDTRYNARRVVKPNTGATYHKSNKRNSIMRLALYL